ncbi:putative diguanylate cyclase DgcT [BD1-7 clade bacterium]|uniref:diguanylate cyclase n=1 Tax=BD1-7 clade bacterium TaxID=2029982 RepID=A0A5S9QYT9_9GAMM|nr:putative diguanylate cyclase DgcT [BD1-7 clade bacterium]
MTLVDKRILRVTQALVLAALAPIGWMLLQYLMGIDVYATIRENNLVYWYMFVGSALAFVSFGFYVGTNEMHLESLAITDEATELHNERFFKQRLPEEAARAARLRQHFSLIYISLDHFADINSLYGRGVGNSALKLIANAISGVARKDEIIARVGEAEFVVLLTDCSQGQANIAAARFLKCISDVVFQVEKGKQISITASIGLISSETNNSDEWQLYAFAETAMYRARRDGRNQVAAYNID